MSDARRCIIGCSLLMIGLLVSNPALAVETVPAVSDYARTTAAAVDEFGRGNFAEALVLFEDAYKVRPTARVLRGIAKCAFELHRYTRSIEAIDAALLSSVEPLDDALRADVISLRQRALRFSGLVHVDVKTGGARAGMPEVTVDGRALSSAELTRGVRLDIGDHVIEATWSASPPVRHVLRLLGESETHVRLTPVAEEGRAAEGAQAASPWRRTLGWSLAGVGAATLAGALVFDTVLVPSKLDDFEQLRAADNPAAGDALTSARTMQTVTLVGYGVAAGLLAIGTTLLLWPSRSMATPH